MARQFNTAGPSVSGRHYMINPLERIDLKQIEKLIADQSYFLLHAPRQSGKTTTLMALTEHLNQQGTYKACYVNIQRAQTARERVGRGMRTVCGAITRAARRYLGDERLKDWTQEALELEGIDGVLTGLLERWSEGTQSPIVLMLDEVDTLIGDTLIAVLGQIRSGYAQRPDGFPQAIILCGVRDLSDYRIRSAHQESITSGSPFNIKAASLRLGNFNRDETEALWRQHQEETGQPIDPAIYPELWEDTRGQPWLVNLLGEEVTQNDGALLDRKKTVTLESYYAGRERLIRSRATHIDQLAHKLREERVRPIISDILQGSTAARNYPSEDLDYVADLGLIVKEPQIRIANRIYQEVIPRELIFGR